MVQVFGSGRADPQKTRVESRVNLLLLQVKEIGFGLGQKILTYFAMSTIRPIDINSFYAAMAYGAQRAGKIPQIHGSCLM